MFYIALKRLAYPKKRRSEHGLLESGNSQSAQNPTQIPGIREYARDGDHLTRKPPFDRATNSISRLSARVLPGVERSNGAVLGALRRCIRNGHGPQSRCIAQGEKQRQYLKSCHLCLSSATPSTFPVPTPLLPGPQPDGFFFLAQDLYVLSGQIVRVFGIVWSLCLVLVESEWRFVKKAVPLLDLWLGRGIAHFFIASLTFREAYPSEEGSDFQKSLQLYRTIASASLTACGLVYMAGGVVCMGAIRRARQQREDRLLAAAAEFDELERRRGELRRLLGRSEEP